MEYEKLRAAIMSLKIDLLIDRKLNEINKLKSIPREEVIKKIEETALKLIESMSNDDTLEMHYKRKTWDNVTYTDRVQMNTGENVIYSAVNFDNSSSRTKLLLMIQILEKAHNLLINKNTITQRELYYQLLLKNESDLVDGINCVCSSLNVSPWDLGILSTSKGLVYGNLFIHMSNDEIINCSQSEAGTTIPSNIIKCNKLESNANFVLLIEKDAIFQKLLDENITKKLGPVILITGKGFPDIITRQLLCKIWQHLEIPILALVDADPHGIEIMCVYRFGSLNMAENAELAVPAIKWLGVHPTDITTLAFDSQSLIPLSENDIKKAESLLQRPFIKDNEKFKKQILESLKIKQKAEIEAVCNIGINYLSEVYIPSKISRKQWL